MVKFLLCQLPILSLCYLLLMHCSPPNPPEESGEVDKKIPEFNYETIMLAGTAYRVLEINHQLWMIDNLNLPVEESWCYGDQLESCKQYGRLYTWSAAKAACEKIGWRLPSIEDWEALQKPYQAGTPPGEGAYKALLAGGESGFEALLGGFRYDYGAFEFAAWQGIYWSDQSDAVNEKRAYAYEFFRDYKQFFKISLYKDYAFSCRCVQKKNE